MENTERLITSLEDALIAARQEVIDIEARLTRTLHAAFGPDKGGSVRHYYTRALNMFEKAEQLKAERDSLIERIKVSDCPYESCPRIAGKRITCEKCWTEWVALEGARRKLTNSIALKKAFRVERVHVETAKRKEVAG